MKKCNKCNETLSLELFNKNSLSKDGYEASCKECRNKNRPFKILKCNYCNEEFKSKRDKKYCSKECISNSKRKFKVIKCSYCNNDIEVPNYKVGKYKDFYCNMGCKAEHQKETLKGNNNPNYSRVEYKCDGCSKDILVIKSKIERQRNIFCSHDCYIENASITNVQEVKLISKECKVCNSKVYRRPSDFKENVYCSRECWSIEMANKNRIFKSYVICDFCSKPSLKLLSAIKNNHNVYCSLDCKNNHLKTLMLGENNPYYNPELSYEDRIKERNYPEYSNWRNKVFERDNYTCQCCGDNKGGNLEAHHLYSYNKYKTIRTTLGNGITLCSKCHKSFHQLFGYGDNTKLQFIEYICDL